MLSSHVVIVIMQHSFINIPQSDIPLPLKLCDQVQEESLRLSRVNSTVRYTNTNVRVHEHVQCVVITLDEADYVEHCG